MESVSSDIFESQVPPTDLSLIPLKELREFVEETRSRRDRAQLALDRWSSFESLLVGPRCLPGTWARRE
ncbi:hypothetical protein chiPu_0026379 [Chiloscyllium punctatum]|uniref:Uncharacterized protein n=1 Tax=Chiloscyllium punctatum TaxID=137246 RepID=A0A401THN9_CHIPU|nr:hypothetical protein [Chiloscyllium punctatum]